MHDVKSIHLDGWTIHDQHPHVVLHLVAQCRHARGVTRVSPETPGVQHLPVIILESSERIPVISPVT